MISDNFQDRHKILLGKKYIKIWKEALSYKLSLTLTLAEALEHQSEADKIFISTSD